MRIQRSEARLDNESEDMDAISVLLQMTLMEGNWTHRLRDKNLVLTPVIARIPRHVLQSAKKIAYILLEGEYTSRANVKRKKRPTIIRAVRTLGRRGCHSSEAVFFYPICKLLFTPSPPYMIIISSAIFRLSSSPLAHAHNMTRHGAAGDNSISAPVLANLLAALRSSPTVDKYSARFFTSINPCNIGFIFDTYWCCLHHTGEDGDRITFANNNNEALTGDEQTGNCTLVPVRESFLFGPFPPVCYRQCALALNWIVVLWKVGVTGVSLPKLGTYQGPGQALSHHPLQPNSATPV
ncbi:hypothetical protein J6590_100872 [Homalodisca vitripennis]|nr:hypothetical protein J6590_100872 [Homalodisca vitripennis]